MNQTLFSRKESEDHSPVLCTRNSRVDIQRLRFANHRLSGRPRFLPLNTRTPEERPHSRGDPAREAEPVRRGAARVLAMSPPRPRVPRRPTVAPSLPRAWVPTVAPPTRPRPRVPRHTRPLHLLFPAPDTTRLCLPQLWLASLSHFFRTSSPGPVCP